MPVPESRVRNTEKIIWGTCSTHEARHDENGAKDISKEGRGGNIRSAEDAAAAGGRPTDLSGLARGKREMETFDPGVTDDIIEFANGREDVAWR